MTWHPRGIFDDELAEQFVEFLECEEHTADAPFHRYTDLNGLTEIRLKLSKTHELAQRRREHYAGGERVKSAIFCDWAFGMGVARSYEALMLGGPIKVRAFRTRQCAAEWLGVPQEILMPDP